MVVFVRLLLPLAVVVGGPVIVVGSRGSGPVPVLEQVAGLWQRAVALVEARGEPSPLEQASIRAEAVSPSRADIATAATSQRVSLLTAESIVLPAQELDDPTKRRVADVQRRLEVRGAQYVRLESIDPVNGAASQFRSQCLMPLPGSVFSRPFEANDADPVRAMERVLLDVIQWQQAWPQTADDDAVPEPPSA